MLFNHIRRTANGTGDAGGNGNQTPPPPADNQTADDGLAHLPPEAQAEIRRLREENKTRRKAQEAFEAEKAAAEAQRQKDEQAKLAEQGKWKDLAEQRGKELDGLKEKAALADQLLKGIQDANTARVAKLPDAAKKLVPTGLDAISLSAWLDTAAEVLSKPIAPGLDGGRTGDHGNPPVKASDHYTPGNF